MSASLVGYPCALSLELDACVLLDPREGEGVTATTALVGSFYPFAKGGPWTFRGWLAISARN